MSIGVLKSRRDAKIKQLSEVGPVLMGSITRINVTCGNPNCKCARGEKHKSNVLTRKVGGKTKSIYVPVDMAEEAKGWTRNHRRLKKLVKEISDLNEKILRAHVPTKRAKGKNRARVASRT